MDYDKKFTGCLADVCEYLEIMPVFNATVQKLLNRIKVTGITSDTRRLQPGNIFYAKRGEHYNPFLHLDEIREKGAVAILIDGPNLYDEENEKAIKAAKEEQVEHKESATNNTTLSLEERISNVNNAIKELEFSSVFDAKSNDNATHYDQLEQSTSTVDESDDEGDDQVDDKLEFLPPQAMSAEAILKKQNKAQEQDINDLDEDDDDNDASNASLSKENKISTDAQRMLRSGRKVISTYISDTDYAVRSFHRVCNGHESQLIAEASMLRLVLPSNKSLGGLASFIYGNPSKKLKVIGVTGTNGKSTITNLVAQMLNALGHKCAVFGTLGYGFLDDLQKAANTTLDAITLQQELKHYKELGADYAVMEVSSIGFCEGRVSGIDFYAGAFSNLSRDHLDYHKNMEDYFASKLNFLRLIPSERLVVNNHDESGKRISDLIGNCFEVEINNRNSENRASRNYLNVRKIIYKPSSLELFIKSANNQSMRADLNLMGKFNAENYAVALGIMMVLGFDLKYAGRVANKLKPITGRMECFTKEGYPRLIVDYAHTPDGVEQALKAAHRHTNERGHIFAIVGCGGDRDKGKRPQMAMKASIFADYAILTADNPRTERVEDILEDMLLGVVPAQQILGQDPNINLADKFSQEQQLNYNHPLLRNVTLIKDRRSAIEFAFKQATKDDCIVICGKGHEDYQIFADRTIHFSDREICCELLGLSLPEHDNDNEANHNKENVLENKNGSVKTSSKKDATSKSTATKKTTTSKSTAAKKATASEVTTAKKTTTSKSTAVKKATTSKSTAAKKATASEVTTAKKTTNSKSTAAKKATTSETTTAKKPVKVASLKNSSNSSTTTTTTRKRRTTKAQED